MKLCIYSWFGYPIPTRERASMIREAGFDSVMIWWGDEYLPYTGEPKETLPDLFRASGLEVENVHMPYAGANHLWRDDLAGEAIFERCASCIEGCRTWNIPTAVMHPTSGDAPPPLSETGFERIRRLAEKAEECGVNLALENVRRPDYMEAVFSRVDSDRLKFCYDSGHENCFTPDLDVLETFGRRLVTMHLHDNNGKLDQHLLPFDGTISWERVMKRLASLGWDGPLCFESAASHDRLGRYTATEYLSELTKRAERLAEMLRAE